MINPALLEVSYSTLGIESFKTTFYIFILFCFLLIFTLIISEDYIKSYLKSLNDKNKILADGVLFSLAIIFSLTLTFTLIGMGSAHIYSSSGSPSSDKFLPSNEIVTYSLEEQPAPEHIKITKIYMNGFNYEKVNNKVSSVLIHSDNQVREVDPSGEGLLLDLRDDTYNITVHDNSNNILSQGEINLQKSTRSTSYKNLFLLGLYNLRHWLAISTLVGLVGGFIFIINGLFNLRRENKN